MTPRSAIWPGNPLTLGIALAGWAAALFADFVATAPNRVAAGIGHRLVEIADAPHALALASGGLLLLAAGWARPGRAARWATALLAMAILLVALDTAGAAASDAAKEAASPAARCSLDAGFWLLTAASIAAMATSLRGLFASPARRAVAGLVPLVVGVALVASGRLDQLSLLREYASDAANFWTEFGRHLVLVAAGLGPALLLGLPLGAFLTVQARWRGPVLRGLGIIQTVPTIALFGLLMTPLAAAGLPGIGLLPAAIALALYALLPIVRNTVEGLRGVDPAVIDSATGLGFAPRQLFWQLRVPLALPLILAGLRVATVQSVGLAVVAALIGAGGLGSFVFLGLGQDALDTVLLGALPAAALAILAHAGLGAVQHLLEARG